jgi:hypothetical protein
VLLASVVGVLIAAATSLGFVSGLLIRSMENVAAIDLGYSASDSLVLRIVLPRERYTGPQQQKDFLDAALVRVRAIPGVASAALSDTPPLSRAVMTIGELTLEEPGRPAESLQPLVGQRVSPGYFESVGMRVDRGRPFSEADRRADAPVVVIDEAFRRMHIPSGDPLAAGIRMGGRLCQIIGVVGDVRQDGPLQAARATLYLLRSGLDSSAGWFAHLVVRPSRAGADLAERVVSEVVRLDPQVVIDDPVTFRALLAENVADRRRTLRLLALSAAVVLVLTAFSISGALREYVENKLHEIALRKALGASRRETVRFVFGHLGRPTAAGVGCGALGGWMLAHLLSSQLVGLGVADPVTIFGTIAALMALGGAAAAGALWQAVAVDPALALRTDG